MNSVMISGNLKRYRYARALESQSFWDDLDCSYIPLVILSKCLPEVLQLRQRIHVWKHKI